MSGKLDLILKKLETIEQEQKVTNTRLNEMDQRLDKIESELATTKEMVATIGWQRLRIDKSMHDQETLTTT